MGGIKKTLILERRKKVVEKTANQYLAVVVVSLFLGLIFIRAATLETFVDSALKIIAIFFLFIFTTWRYIHEKSVIKCINKELEQCEIENRMVVGRKLRFRL